MTQIHRELQSQGCRHSYETVRRYVERLGCKVRRGSKPDGDPANLMKVAPAKPAMFAVPSPRRASFWLVNPKKERPIEQQTFVENLYATKPDIHDTVKLAQQFVQMVRQREPDTFNDWLVQAEQDRSLEMRGFAACQRAL